MAAFWQDAAAAPALLAEAWPRMDEGEGLTPEPWAFPRGAWGVSSGAGFVPAAGEVGAESRSVGEAGAESATPRAARSGEEGAFGRRSGLVYAADTGTRM